MSKLSSRPKKFLFTWRVGFGLIFSAAFFFVSLCFYFPWKIDSEVLSLVSNAGDAKVETLGEQAYEQMITRKIAIAFQGESWDQLKAAAQELKDQWMATGHFASVQHSVTDDLEKHLWQFYAPHRHQILDQKIFDDVSRDGGQGLLQERLANLYSPWGQGSSASLGTDPLGLLNRFLLGLAPESGLATREGFFTGKASEKNETSIFIFAELKAEVDQSLLTLGKRLNPILDKISSSKGLRALRLGAPFYAEAGVRRGFQEAQWIGGLSLIGVLGLLLLTFRSFGFYLLVMMTLSLSATFGAVLTHLIFGRLHLFALVAGTSLLGLGADYIFHFSCTPLSEGLTDGFQARQRILKPMLLSFVSSVLGYSALLFVPLPGLQQLATFIIFGMTLTLLIVVFFFPRIPFSFFQNNIIPRNAEKKIAPSFLVRIPISIFLSLPILVLMILVNVPSLFNDKPQTFQSKDSKLVVQEKKLQAFLSPHKDKQLLYFWQDSQESLLRSQEDYFSNSPYPERDHYIAKYIPSLESQKRSQQLYQSLSPKRIQLAKHFKLADLAPEPTGRFLEMDALKRTPLRTFTASLWFQEINGTFYSVASTAASNPLLRRDGVKLFEPFSRLTKGFQTLRVHLLTYGALGVLLIFIFLGIKSTFQVAFFLLIAPTTGVLTAVFGGFLLHGAVNLFHILSCFLVFSLGLDYALFHGSSGTTLSTRRALWASFLTTMIAFGALALSQTLAVSAFGFSLAVGLITCYALAPVAQRCHGKF